MVAPTNAHSAKQMPEDHTRMPSATTAAPDTIAAATGHVSECIRFDTVDLRHASSGDVPISTSSASPIGRIHVLKNGGPTVSRSPRTASLIVGNIVANRTKKADNSRIQLFARN